MTFHEAMREAERRADEAKAAGASDAYGSAYARATGALIVHLANELHDHSRAKTENAELRSLLASLQSGDCDDSIHREIATYLTT